MNQTKDLSLLQTVEKRGGGITSGTLSILKKVLGKIPTGTLVNSAIDALPIELHLPGYRYCGPGTKLKERLDRGDPGINKLDEACKAHDIAYSNYSDTSRRSLADRVLAEKAWQRAKSSDASFGERTAALAVAAAMKTKRAVGGGRSKRRRTPRRRNRRTPRVSGGGRNKKKVTRRRKCGKCSKTNGRGLFLRPHRVY